MNEQAGIFLTDEEVLDLADILHECGLGNNLDWKKGYHDVMDKVFECAVEILIKNEKEQTK